MTSITRGGKKKDRPTQLTKGGSAREARFVVVIRIVITVITVIIVAAFAGFATVLPIEQRVCG